MIKFRIHEYFIVDIKPYQTFRWLYKVGLGTHGYYIIHNDDRVHIGTREPYKWYNIVLDER